jgi:hypothetical protein
MFKKNKLKNRMTNILTIDRNEKSNKAYRDFCNTITKVGTAADVLALSIQRSFYNIK